MFEKDMSVGILLDFYKDLLSERKREILNMYYNEDLTLKEISDLVGISRQGARNLIKKAGSELRFFEEKLSLAAKFAAMRRSAENIKELSEKYSVPGELRGEIEKLISLAQ